MDRRAHASPVARFHSHVIVVQGLRIATSGLARSAPMAASLLPHPRGCGTVRSPAPLGLGDRVRCGGCWGARAPRLRQPGAGQDRGGDKSLPARHFRLAGRQHGTVGAVAADMRCDGSIVEECGRNGRWRCAKRCATAGMTSRCRRRCSETSRGRGEFRRCPLGLA